MDLTKAQALVKEAENHGGHCSNCHQAIKIYRYGISTSMVRVLKAMARSTDKNTGRAIDVDELKLKHSERTQLTKMRFHGLVAKVKDDGVQIPRHWLITRKGWQFLANEPVPAKVLVYNNQVLGHDGGTTEIKRIDGEADAYDAIPVTEAESRTYAEIRKPEYNKSVQAKYLGYTAGDLNSRDTYELLMAKLQVGKPIQIKVPKLDNREFEYRDIAAFGKSWQIIND